MNYSILEVKLITKSPFDSSDKCYQNGVINRC